MRQQRTQPGTAKAASVASPAAVPAVAVARTVSDRGADGLRDRLRAKAAHGSERTPAFDVSRTPALRAVRHLDHASEFPEGIH